MKLARLRMRNFRCYGEERPIDFDDITVLVGKNDSGKSSVMEAIDIFLSDNTPDKHDGCKWGNCKDLTIICEFEDLPEEVIIDDEYPTSFTDEYLLNGEGRLEIHKTYSGHTAAPKCTGVYAYALHPTVDGINDLLQLKNADLKKRATTLKLDLSAIDQRVNAQIRRLVRESVGKLDLAPTLIPLNDENAKKAWEGIRIYLPAFALFKSDRASIDQDPEAQDPLKAAVKEAIKQKEVELNAITAHVEQEVRKIAQKTLEKLSEMDPHLATELNPQFTPPRWDTLFKASITGDDDIPINKRGSGVRRLILLSFLRAKAEQQAKEKGASNIIYAVEEPETSQHPNNQRMLVRAFSELAGESQVILSTHTPMLARSFPEDNLRYIQINKDKTRSVLKGGEETNQLFAKALGVLPDNTVKLFIGVEGKNDIAFLTNISKVLRNSGVNVIDLEKMELDGEIIFFPLGGSNLALWTTRLKKLNRPEFHLFDRDVSLPAPAKYRAQVDEINGRENCKARSTAKKEMENYLHKDAIVQAYSSFLIPINILANFGDFDDVPQEVAKLVHQASGSDITWDALSEKKRNEKKSKAKRILNTSGSSFMTKQMLEEVDPQSDLLKWFQDMQTLLG